MLSGGAGSDSLMFGSAPDANTILDFNVVQDTIRLENLFMQALGAGTLDRDAFHIAAAADAEDRMICNAGNGNLSYDADSAGGAASTLFAILHPGLSLAGTGFTIL